MIPVTNTMNTNIEVNKQIHTILGKCWHDSQQISNLVDDWTKCSKCGYFQGPNPNYAGSLDAVAEAERWVIEKVGLADYADELIDVVEADCQDVIINVCGLCATASALQRATACLKALGGKG